MTRETLEILKQFEVTGAHTADLPDMLPKSVELAELKATLKPYGILYVAKTKQFTCAKTQSFGELKDLFNTVIDNNVDHIPENVPTQIAPNLDFELFDTPEDIADKMVELLSWGELHDPYSDQAELIFEPSCGNGSLIRSVLNKYDAEWNSLVIVFCESKLASFEKVLQDFDEQIKEQTVIHCQYSNFFSVKTKAMGGEPGRSFAECKYILMAPPIGTSYEHIYHAFKILKSGGKIVCLIKFHPDFPEFSESRDFSIFLEEETEYYDIIDFETTDERFKEFHILVIDKA